ncbi:hypothetical protein WDV85_05930 [Pseudokineococcus sp. 5B2Z-1]|uniref:GH36-type glycosyl hydrolase domain-containing protein n=1 Tax=Pseudokineococcus sp. 5B2Z-1 TaxID=3132744 RepID=UPI0030A05AAC
MTTTAPATATPGPAAGPAAPDRDGGAVLAAGDLRVHLTGAGDVRAIRSGDLLVNLHLPSRHDAAVAGVVLRRHRAGQVERVALAGSASPSALATGPTWARWAGEALGARWTAVLSLAEDGRSFVWRVDLAAAEGDGPEPEDRYDVVVAQDLALAPEGVVRANEAYTSHYVAHRVVPDARAGVVVASRQTMACAPVLPLALTALVEGARGHHVDAVAVHGPAARGGGRSAALDAPEWASGARQHETAMPTLLGPLLDLAEPRAVHAVTALVPDHRGDLRGAPAAVPGLLDDAVALAARTHEALADAPAGEQPVRSLLATAPLLAARDLTEAELLALGGVDASSARSPERGDDGALRSYFTGTAAYVVSRAAELEVERPHGLVLRAGDDVAPTEGVLSATAYAAGVLASHVVMGNTAANTLVSVHRSALGLLRSAGVRALVREPGGGWRLLGVPSALVLDLGGVRWRYASDLGLVDVRTTVRADAAGLEVRVDAERPLEVLLTADLDGAWDLAPVEDDEGLAGRALLVTPSAGSDVADHCPGLAHVVATTGRLGDDAPLLADGVSRGTRVLTAALEAGSGPGGGTSGALLVTADLHERERALGLAREQMAGLDVEDHLARHREHLASLVNHLRVRSGGRFAELDLLVPWYAQNAMVHLHVPHGLEQYTGAAWGTRDVCQGPLELMLAVGRHDVARHLVLAVLARQDAAGELPQWFMPDAYAERSADDAHGDVPVWPLVALVEYLGASGDLAVLDEVVPFWDTARRRPADEPATVADHVRRTLEHARAHRAPGTQLLAYGHGDWDDTLQPAEASMRERMTSSWTVALWHQAARGASRLLAGTSHADLGAELGREADLVAAELAEHLLLDGELAGYLVVPPPGSGERPRPVLHPRDDVSPASHRLIPMTQAVLAGLLTPEQAVAHETLVERHLHFPDGVRLMDAPAPYDDGVTHVFRRAEQSAFFGREVGLMYTHAHLRYVEALAVLGRERVVEELLRTSPVEQRRRLPAAEPKQRNCYYSSSDAAFDDRYEAAERFEELRTGRVPVRGGWRVYSSGPGIFVRQLVQGVLGVVERAGAVVLDPVLAREDDGLVVELDVLGEPRELRYRVVGPAEAPAGPVRLLADGREVAGAELDNPYRRGGLLVDGAAIAGARVLEVVLPAGRGGTPDTAVAARR